MDSFSNYFLCQGLGTYDLYDSQLTYTTSLTVNCTVEAKHPEKGSLHEAIINKIIDKSQYTVVFDDGDIATLRRNALRMKSGKHFNASESLDNLPLTHPEHFGTPVGSRRRGKFEEEEDEEEEEDTSDDESELVPYNQKIGSVVCVEVPDKKSSKSKENWFPGLVVSPYAVSQDQGKFNRKEDFLVRSFKDNKFHTVPRTECKKFHKDMGRGVSDSAMIKALEHAQAYINNNETLPVHWDKEILLEMREESTTEGESEDDELILSDDDELQSHEEKDHLVAELYKHMDERGTPINKNPCIGDQEVDLFKLFRCVQKLGGHQRVTNNSQWRVVAKKLGFETNWCVNQVRVCYKRYLQSFEELNRTLGCTLINHPRNTSLRVRHGSGRPLVRGVRTGSKVKDEDDKSSVSSQEGGDLSTPSAIKKEDCCDEIDLDKPKPETEEKKIKKTVSNVIDKIVKDEPLEEEVEIFENSRKVKEAKGKKGKEERMLTRPRRDSSSSLAAATELKAKKDEIGESSKLRKESKKDLKKLKDEDDKSDSGGSGPIRGTKTKKLVKKKEEEAFDAQDDECNSDLDNVSKKEKKKVQKKKGNKAAELAPVEPMAGDDGEEPQHLKLSVECSPGDKIKVFWLHGQIYEAKIIKTDKPTRDKWPKYYVHYQGWNQRYDEWITRGRIAENLTWNANPQKHSKSSKSSTPPPERTRQRVDKQEKRSSDEDEKRDSDERLGSEEEKEEGTRRKQKSARSSTPSSTPSSSRTSSPAHNKRTKSPAPRRPNSPKDSKEKTPGREKKGMSNRTNSPAQRKSPVLKRQSSRNSITKVSEQSDDDFEISEPEDEEEKPTKKPAKHPVKEATEPKPETPRRTKSDAKSKKPNLEADKEEKEEKKVEQSKAVMRSRRSNTPTKKLHDDPYVFQEPEPIEPMGPFVKIENISAAEIAKQTKSDTAFQTDIATKMKNEESDAKKENSKTDTEAKTTETIKTEDIKEESKTDEDSQTKAETDKMTEDDKPEDSVKEEVKEENEEGSAGEKSDLRSTLFPHLSSLRPGTTSNVTSSHDSSPDTEAATTIHIDSATMINSIVESSILKETREVKASSSGSDTKKESGSGHLADHKEESKDDASTEVPSPPRQRTRKKKSTKVRNLRNPTHKSREVVTDSDSDSEDEKPKAKPVTPRRKTIETERVKTPKRIKEPNSEEDEVQSSKKLKRRKEEEEDSLVCQETLPGSPVQVCTTEIPSTAKVTTGREERSSSRVELPFASVAEAGAAGVAGAKPGLTSSLKTTDSPPATPESPVSVESPLTRSRKEDGRKSPADSSEVDMESLSGQGKAGSEDSRMDIECSSSSDTKNGRGRRRQTASKDVEKEEEKTFPSGKRKRKTRGDSSGRGRGKGRGRNSSGVGRAVGRHNEDSEDSEKDGQSQEEPRLDRLDNAALAALATPRPNSTSKYNFYVMLSKLSDYFLNNQHCIVSVQIPKWSQAKEYPSCRRRLKS